MAVARPDQAKAEPPGSETIEELFAALESPLLAYALRLSGERSAAEDLVQDSFMKLRPGSFSPVARVLIVEGIKQFRGSAKSIM